MRIDTDNNIDFYPRSPCGERRLSKNGEQHTQRISIHALLAESDHFKPYAHNAMIEFLSTLSLRRATVLTTVFTAVRSISIHALLAESDKAGIGQALDYVNFYPRSPCGERLPRNSFFSFFSGISIHALLAESDVISEVKLVWHLISIHALLAESDCGTKLFSSG